MAKTTADRYHLIKTGTDNSLAEIERIKALKRRTPYHVEKVKRLQKWVREHADELKLLSDVHLLANDDTEKLRIARIDRAGQSRSRSSRLLMRL